MTISNESMRDWSATLSQHSRPRNRVPVAKFRQELRKSGPRNSVPARSGLL